MVVKEVREYRTIMYTLRQEKGHEGEVVVHRLPFNGRDKDGMEKLQRFVKRGFTFEDPRKGRGLGYPEVIETKRVEVVRLEEEEGEAIKVSEAEIKETPKTSEIRCSDCGRVCKSLFGLSVHQRVHEGK